MKKTTLLIASALLAVTNMIAQDDPTILVNRPFSGNGFSIGTTQGTNGSTYVGDQFEITEDSTLGTLEVFGVPSNLPTLESSVLGFNVFIYEDNNGAPAGHPALPDSEVVGFASIPTSTFTILESGDGERTDFRVNLEAANGGSPVTLSAGTYWLVAQPVVNSTSNGLARWNWRPSINNPSGTEPLYIDPNDILGLGVINWESFITIGASPGVAMAWILTDQFIPLSTQDNVIEGLSISPNPTNGIVNFNLPGNVQLDNISVYDVSGRKVINNNNVNTVDLTNYSRGIYIAKLTTATGEVQSARIVRK